MKKYPVRVLEGKYKGMDGYTYYEKPNKYGNVMVFSNRGYNPYQVCLGAEKVKYLKDEGEEE